MATSPLIQKILVQFCFVVWPFLAFVLLCTLYFAGSTKVRIPDTAYLKIGFVNSTVDTVGGSICHGNTPQYYLVYLWNICEQTWLDRKPNGALDQNTHPTTCCSPWKPSVNYNLGYAVSNIFPEQIQIGTLESNLAAQFLYVIYILAAVMSAVGFLAEGAFIAVKERWIRLRLTYHFVVFLIVFMASTVSTTVMDIILIKLSDATDNLGVDLIRGTTWLCLTWGAVIAQLILLILLLILMVRVKQCINRQVEQKPETQEPIST